jgi:hypothetical protein
MNAEGACVLNVPTDQRIKTLLLSAQNADDEVVLAALFKIFERGGRIVVRANGSATVRFVAMKVEGES